MMKKLQPAKIMAEVMGERIWACFPRRYDNLIEFLLCQVVSNNHVATCTRFYGVPFKSLMAEKRLFSPGSYCTSTLILLTTTKHLFSPSVLKDIGIQGSLGLQSYT
jgi:hypothetical protein